MISAKTLKTIEYDKICSILSGFAVLKSSKEVLENFTPLTDIKECKFLLDKTEEAYNLLYKYNLNGVYFFEDISSELKRVDMHGTLNNLELLRVEQNLKSARILKESVASVSAEELKYLPELAKGLYTNLDFEKEITSKILSEDEISDNASNRLYSIRKNIRDLNSKIREKLNSYIRGGLSKYLQDAVVTMRLERYVIPVKSEYRSMVKGFIHDQSSSGSTVFIEPAEVMDLNNELKHAFFEEADEIQQILRDLSEKVSNMTDALRYNAEIISEFDIDYARAEYAFKTKATKPILNAKGIINIKRGRHPLINSEKVVPINVSLGENYNFLLVTGPNTGGKTVTMKLVGLFTLMAMSGLYIQAEEESKISFFNGVYCDIGDEQSIEQNLSTFSSHITNIIDIINNVNSNSLVLLDELGAGTDPDEGSALALAVIDKLLSENCFGIITTHYSKLKEFAMENGKIENASMEFDCKTLKPLYRLNVGIPGSSNAIDIAKTLGLSNDVINKANSYLSDKTISFEKVLKKAEETRMQAEEKERQLEIIRIEKDKELQEIKAEKEKIVSEREKINYNARQETKRIVSDKLSEAEEIIFELKDILKRANLESKEVFRASELKNRLENSRYLDDEFENSPYTLIAVEYKKLVKGDKVFVKSINANATIQSVKLEKGEAEVLVGSMRTVVKLKDLYQCEQLNKKPIKKDENVKVKRNAFLSNPVTEINVIGKTSLEALDEVKNFIDQGVVNNLEELKIIHGVGQGILLKEIREYLKNDKNVAEFRRGKYGEGENGVTIVKLK